MEINTNNIINLQTDHTPNTIMIHHTAGNQNATVADLLRVFSGWTRRGYHYFITSNGSVFQLHNESSQTWGAANDNNGRIHISLAGNFEIQHPTSIQLSSLGNLVRDIRHRRGNLRVLRHMDGNRQATVCSGRHLNMGAINNAIGVIDTNINVNDVVTVNNTATNWVTGEAIPTWVQGQSYPVIEMRYGQLLLGNGINSWIRTSDVTKTQQNTPHSNATLNVGQTLNAGRIKSDTRYMDPPYHIIPDFVRNRNNTIKEVSNNRIVISYSGTVVGALRRSDID